MRSALIVSSTSRAQDAGYHALADVADVAATLDVEYRIVGGHMVSLLVQAYEATGAPARETADADLAAPFQVLGDPRLRREGGRRRRDDGLPCYERARRTTR